MKLLFILAIILLSNVSFGQYLVKQKAAIDLEVRRISKQGNSKTASFSIQAPKKMMSPINYQYVESKTGYVKINRQFSYDNEITQQTFYLKDGGLLYATESIISYFTEKSTVDTIVWRGTFYFTRGKLIDYSTLGHGKSEDDRWNPEREMLAVLNESKRDIARYKKKKSGR